MSGKRGENRRDILPRIEKVKVYRSKGNIPKK